MAETAVLLTDGMFTTPFGKTAHGLVRGPCRYHLVGMVDAEIAGRDAGEALDGTPRGIPTFASLDAVLQALDDRPRWAVIAVATSGGVLPPRLRATVQQALELGIGVVNGLHQLLADDAELADTARRHGAEIVDVRRPPPHGELHFWTGEIAAVRAPRIAVLGTDCALGKRTTAAMLVDGCRRADLRAEMVYTGQTGWLQGWRFGFVLDATPNDFVSGELEHAVVSCDREAEPDLILLEGQSSLRNPSGPCGAELLLSAGAQGVILQHAPGRKHFIDQEEIGTTIPSLRTEVDLIAAYGGRVLAVALQDEGIAAADRDAVRRRAFEESGALAFYPLHDGVDGVVPLLRHYIEAIRR